MYFGVSKLIKVPFNKSLATEMQLPEENVASQNKMLSLLTLWEAHHVLKLKFHTNLTAIIIFSYFIISLGKD